MKATEAGFLDFLKKSPRFIIPIYQRSHAWTGRQCRRLRDDIVRTRNGGGMALSRDPDRAAGGPKDPCISWIHTPQLQRWLIAV